MTAAAETFIRRAPAETRGRLTRLGPAEGWSSVLLLGLMCAIVGWAIDDSRWVLGPQSLTDPLSWAGLLGLAWGATAGILRRGRLFAHLGGAVAATVVLSLLVGSVLRPGSSPTEFFQATSDSIAGAYIDLVVLRRLTTTEVGHFVLVLGILVWGTGQFAGYTAFGHRRPLAAVLVPGAILLGNIALTRLDQYGLLVVYSLAALIFLLRFHIADEERAWRRHRIADAGDAVGIYVRAGAAFIAVAVVGALVLTRSASSAPLAGAWVGVNQQLIDIGNQIARLFPAGGPGTRLGGPGFGTSVTISGAWVTDDAHVVTIQTRRDWTPVKWRAAAYDRLTGSTWSVASAREISTPAGGAPLDGTNDAPLATVSYVRERFLVSGPTGAPGILLSPGIPLLSDRIMRTTVARSGDSSFWSVVLLQGGGQYGALAAVPDISDPADPRTITANRLRNAGTDYPADLEALYTDIQPGVVGPETSALAERIVADSGADNPYDIARAMEAYLRNGSNFTYDTDITDIDCGDNAVVECFVINRRGYCEHYASTMTMMLRDQGIPARFVEGYLPGERDQDGTEIIKRNGAHAWVQVWFPDAGWVDFDPTGGGVGVPSLLPTGAVAASPSPPGAASPSRPPSDGRDQGLDTNPGGAGRPLATNSGGWLPVVIGLVVVAGLLLLLLAALYRRMGRPTAPEAAYRTVATIAARLGHGRRPTQTVYEYVGTLAEAVPSVEVELQLVGRSAVEAVYGRKRLPQSRLEALGAAQRRLRVALLRLLFIRRRRKSRR